jgi:hypothetical protein
MKRVNDYVSVMKEITDILMHKRHKHSLEVFMIGTLDDRDTNTTRDETEREYTR